MLDIFGLVGAVSTVNKVNHAESPATDLLPAIFFSQIKFGFSFRFLKRLCHKIVDQ
jgi:hypothetical protein